jgi:hypothetical protein
MIFMKYLGLEHRFFPRHTMPIDVEFQVLDEAEKKPRTHKVPGRLTDITLKGARLQIPSTLIEGYHLLRDNDLEGKTSLILDLPAFSEGSSVTLKAKVLWYNRIESQRKFPFDVGLKFIDVSEMGRKQIEAILRAESVS